MAAHHPKLLRPLGRTVVSAMLVLLVLNTSAFGEKKPSKIAVRLDTSDADPADFNVEIEGLPAVSADGKKVAFISSLAEYDEALTVELRIVDRDGRAAEVLLADRADLASRKVVRAKARKRDLQRRAHKARALLEAGQFVSLSPARQGSDESNQIAHLLRDGKKVKVGAWRIGYREGGPLKIFDDKGHLLISYMPELKRTGFCCPGDDDDIDRKCSVGYDSVAAWGDERVLFVLGSNLGGPDSCELDAQYVTFWPAEKAWVLESD